MSSARLEAHGEICKTDPCQLCQEADSRIRAALDHIQMAQTELERATAKLASLEGCLPEWKRAGKLYEQVHAFWYRVERTRQRGRFQLDSLAADALRRKLAGSS